MAVHVDAGYRALAHADGGAAVAGDHAAKELEKHGVVTDGENALAVGIFREHMQEAGVIGVGGERGADLNFSLVAHLGSHKLRGLQGALERAGDDDVQLHVERAEQPRHQHALVLSLFDEGPLGVEERVSAGNSGIGVTHEVEDHGDGSGREVRGAVCQLLKRLILTHL